MRWFSQKGCNTDLYPGTYNIPVFKRNTQHLPRLQCSYFRRCRHNKKGCCVSFLKWVTLNPHYEWYLFWSMHPQTFWQSSRSAAEGHLHPEQSGRRSCAFWWHPGSLTCVVCCGLLSPITGWETSLLRFFAPNGISSGLTVVSCLWTWVEELQYFNSINVLFCRTFN